MVKGSSLFVYGGVFEYGNREWALDDAWVLDLNARDEWRCVLPGTKHDFDTSGEASSDDEEDEEGDEGGGGGMEEDLEGEHRAFLTGLGLEDEATTPRPDESLRDFFARSASHWATSAMSAFMLSPGGVDESELRKEAFSLAGARFDEVQSALKRLGQLDKARKTPTKARKNGGKKKAK